MSAAVATSPGVLRTFLVLATLMQALDSTIANVALTRMGGDLAAASDQLNWVLTSYIVAAAITTPATGWLTTWFGRRRLFVMCCVGFVLASMACGMSRSIVEIVIFRALQGVFGAPLAPLAQSVLFETAPPNGRAKAMALFGIGIMVGPIIGPALGGWLCDAYDWRWVFYVNLPIGALAAIGLWSTMPPDGPRNAMKFDLTGFSFLSLGVAALQLFLDRGSELNWFQSVEIRIEFGLAVLGLYLYIVHTVTAKRPLIDRRVFMDANMIAGLLLIFVVGSVLMSTLSLLSPYVENIMGYPVLTAGLVLAPRGVGTIAAMLIVGRYGDRFDPRLFLGLGMAILAYALYLMAHFTNNTSAEMLIVSGIVQGVGLGFTMVPMSTLAFATLDKRFSTDGTAMFSLVRNIGGSIGISTMSYLVTRESVVAYANMSANVNPFSLGLQQYREALNPATRAGAEMLNLAMEMQAQIIAYSDVFLLMCGIVAALVPTLFLLRTASAPAPSG